MYYPIIIRDQEKALDPPIKELRGIDVFSEIPWNLDLRLALYESSYLNLMVNNGPALLCYLDANVRYLVFKMITPSAGSCTIEHFNRIGMKPGIQLKIASSYQKIIWQDDGLDIIQREFELMVQKIEGNI